MSARNFKDSNSNNTDAGKAAGIITIKVGGVQLSGYLILDAKNQELLGAADLEDGMYTVPAELSVRIGARPERAAVIQLVKVA